MGTKEKIEELMGTIMFDLLQIPKTESNEGTPHRLAKMWYDELFATRNDAHIGELKEKIKTFDNPNTEDDEVIIVRDIPFCSVCEHHWLPFTGKVSIGYVPGEKVLGLSKLPRIVKYFSKRPQLQEQFTKQIRDFIVEVCDCKAVFVKVVAEHQCVKCRGAESDCETVTFLKYVDTEWSLYSVSEEWEEDFKRGC